MFDLCSYIINILNLNNLTSDTNIYFNIKSKLEFNLHHQLKFNLSYVTYVYNIELYNIV